jgi:large subunit ribosomal protein L10
MSKPVKNLITDQYRDLFGGINGAVLVDIRGVDSNTTNGFRAALGQKNVKITVVKNSLAKRAFDGGVLEPLGQWVEGSNTLVYPTDEETSVVQIARELLDWAKKIEKLQFKGAVMDGITFGPNEIKKLSEYPTKEEAQAKVVTMLLSPARNLVGAIKSPASNLAGILKTIQEKLEKGEAIAKIA